MKQILALLTVVSFLVPLSASAQSTLALQEKCANGAREYYEREVGKEKHPGCIKPNYTNHYNRKLDKCFILITTHCTGDYSSSIALTDAFERETYAIFVIDKEKCRGSNKPWVDCGGVGMGKLCDDDKKCKTWREIEDLIRPYMEK